MALRQGCFLMSEDRYIEEEFASSWDKVEEFYYRLSLYVDSRWRQDEWGASMLSLLAKLRKHNFDKKLRAGNTRAVLILSRSRSHGLRASQPFIEFHRDTVGLRGISVTYHEGPNTRMRIDLDKVELTAQVNDLLNRLIEHPID
jgi:hypothetical protein